MLRNILVLAIALALLPCSALAQQGRRGPVVTTPENAQYLFERTVRSGTLVMKVDGNRPNNHHEHTFRIGFKELPKAGVVTDMKCLDPKVEAVGEGDRKGIVFDAHCKLPFVIEGKRYFVWGQVRMVILVDTGEAALGSTDWIEANSDGTGTSIFSEAGSVEALLREVIDDMVTNDKRTVALLEELRTKNTRR